MGIICKINKPTLHINITWFYSILRTRMRCCKTLFWNVEMNFFYLQVRPLPWIMPQIGSIRLCFKFRFINIPLVKKSSTSSILIQFINHASTAWTSLLLIVYKYITYCNPMICMLIFTLRIHASKYALHPPK